MRYGLLVLQFSHVFYFLAATMAWEKGYKAFSLALFLMIAVSMITHRSEEVSKTTYVDTSALEWFEKSVVIGVATFSAVQFNTYIDITSWILLGFSAAFFVLGHTSYYAGRQKEYLTAHTIWHLGTGLAILRVIKATPRYED
jgi:hypothetical protein